MASRPDRFIFPLIAVGYTAYLVGESFVKHFHASTITYGLVLAAPIFLLAGWVLWTEYRGPKPAAPGAEPTLEASGDVVRASRRRLEIWPSPMARNVMFVGLAVCFIMTTGVLGYFLAFFLFTGLSALLLGARSPWAVLGTALGMALVVHFVFVGFLGLKLPAGLLAGLI